MIGLHRVMAGKRRGPASCLLGLGGWLAGAGLVAALLASGTALAQVLISPVVVELGTRQRAVAVTVTLSDTVRAPMRLQADLLRWKQDVQGQAVTEPSDDLVVTPPIAELRPGGQQVFRVALRGVRPAPEELAYRLILEDVAEPSAAADSAPGMVIKFRMRYDLPVLVAPAGPVANALRWKPCATEGAPSALALPVAPPAIPHAEACVRLLNAGNRRVKVQKLTLAGDGWQQALSLKEGENVLAGAEREWRVPLAKGQAGPLRSVQVLTARGETLQAEAGDF
ncbi:MAG: pilus assembly protein chaperone PapD-like protein [Massilia sp.]|jgi:fimbrial chaperone protein|nr:pilus assembly protein chaperone PapD-like protein [Massilia sp.]